MTVASTRPMIALSLAGRPPQVVIQATNVSQDAWAEIALTIAELDHNPTVSQPLIIRTESLLKERYALRGILGRHRIGLSADDAVSRILMAATRDDDAVRSALIADPDDGYRESSTVLSQTAQERELIRQLRPFQVRDLTRLAELTHGANFSVPGAGKTTVTYALHSLLRQRGDVDKLLVIAPLSAFTAWEEDATEVVRPAYSIARWRKGTIPNADVILVNYQRLPNSADRLASWMSQRKIHLVVDEAHRAKRGAAGGWGRAVLSLAPFARRRDILTGTPAPNHPRDLVALLDILWPSGIASRALPRRALSTDPPMGAMVSINQAISGLYVRTTKTELKLPPVKIAPVEVKMGPLQQDIYDAMLSRYAGMFDLDRHDSLMFAQMGEVMMYLLQAASSPRLLATAADPARAYRYPPLSIPPGSRLARLVESYADHEVPSKIAHACRIVSENAQLGKKTLVWSNFPDNLLDLEQQLSRLQPAVVYGGVPTGDDAEEGVRTREREIERFRSDPGCMALLANPAAMSEGVSLHHSCHDAVYLDRTFNAGQYLQSLDRIHRLGLAPETSTNITLLITKGTIDERVDHRVKEKTRRLARMLADPELVQMTLPDDDDYGPLIEQSEDLAEILAHLREARDFTSGHLA